MPDDKKYASKATATKCEEINGIKPLPESRFFVKKELWDKYTTQYDQSFSLCWRSLTSPTNARTTIAMILPSCPTCQSIQMLQTENNTDLIMLLALFNSLPFDYFVRVKMPGIDLTQSVIRQIPVPAKESYEQSVKLNGRMEKLKTHIISCVYYLLENEERLCDLLSHFKEHVYPLTPKTSAVDVRKMLDYLFACAYQISEQAYEEIVKSFPKY